MEYVNVTGYLRYKVTSNVTRSCLMGYMLSHKFIFLKVYYIFASRVHEDFINIMVMKTCHHIPYKMTMHTLQVSKYTYYQPSYTEGRSKQHFQQSFESSHAVYWLDRPTLVAMRDILETISKTKTKTIFITRYSWFSFSLSVSLFVYSLSFARDVWKSLISSLRQVSSLLRSRVKFQSLNFTQDMP